MSFIFQLTDRRFVQQGMEVSTIIVKQKDLGCNASKVHILEQDKGANDSQAKAFWKALGGKSEIAGELSLCIIFVRRARRLCVPVIRFFIQVTTGPRLQDIRRFIMH